MRSILGSGLLVATLLLAGCAAHRQPTEQLALSETAIAVALEAGAGQLAAADLKSAQAKVALGKRYIAAKEYQAARWLVEQAQVDAELAAMKAVSARALQEASRQAGDFRQFNRLTALHAR